ncbi:sigma-70 family RNA polymerase sigma factor [Pseudonocardia benzenivorans]|uniref:Sigma-70 family RNA polymerase sigma factor n=1 Tax=Pseudonocardia benzenivorans TaxID=228005 RepID=A0ABW3VI08_9PSEU|nr:RNA polymerase sigma factor [Pseudonocardia sp. D17]
MPGCSVLPLVTAARAAPEAPDTPFAAEEAQLRRLSTLPRDDPEHDALRTELILAFLPVAERLVGRYATSRPWSRDDIAQAASEAVVRAVDHWDPDRARGDVLGYLVPCVRGAILRWFRDQSWSLRVPRRVKDLSVAIRQAVGPLSQELGRAPRPSELARRLDVDVDEIVEALYAEDNHQAATLDAPAGDDDSSPGERIGDVDPRLGRVEDVETLRPLLAGLSERERRIVVLRFFCGRTQSQIGEEIGVSQMHVSRLLAGTLAKLRAGMLDERA